jgi:hypothetical protein
VVLDITVATLAGFLLPFSWLAGLLSRWVPAWRFEWVDYLTLWEYEARRQRFWSWFAVGFVLSVVVDIGLVMTAFPLQRVVGR